jgi:hypothetical protein
MQLFTVLGHPLHHTHVNGSLAFHHCFEIAAPRFWQRRAAILVASRLARESRFESTIAFTA